MKPLQSFTCTKCIGEIPGGCASCLHGLLTPAGCFSSLPLPSPSSFPSNGAWQRLRTVTEPWGDNWLLTYLAACRSDPGGAEKSRSKQRRCEVCLALGSAESEDALTGMRSHKGLGERQSGDSRQSPLTAPREEEFGAGKPQWKRGKAPAVEVFDLLGAEPQQGASCAPQPAARPVSFLSPDCPKGNDSAQAGWHLCP